MTSSRAIRPLLHSTELSEHLRMEGTLRTKASLLLKGGFSGVIESTSHVTIERGAVVESCTLSAHTLSVSGRFSGSIAAKTYVELKDKASVSADINAPAMSVSALARFEGHVAMPGIGN